MGSRVLAVERFPVNQVVDNPAKAVVLWTASVGRDANLLPYQLIESTLQISQGCVLVAPLATQAEQLRYFPEFGGDNSILLVEDHQLGSA
jgi:hypothetical protein